MIYASAIEIMSLGILGFAESIPLTEFLGILIVGVGVGPAPIVILLNVSGRVSQAEWLTVCPLKTTNYPKSLDNRQLLSYTERRQMKP